MLSNRPILVLFLLCSAVFFSIEAKAQTLSAQQQQTVSNLFRNRGEICFKFNISSRQEIAVLTKIISIDNVKNNNEVFAYANKEGFSKFLLLNYAYITVPNPNTLQKVKMGQGKFFKQLQSTTWDTYPTYPAYESIMNQFAVNYPNICKLVTLGTLPSGRKLLLLKITDSINLKENEPQFLYTSTMHGDETAGYIGMLHYIDYLLSNYGNDARITNLINNEEIWICPLANPDGTYAGGDTTVNGATRYNGNNIDLNRNYPDPQDGQHPDGNAWQPETQAFMGLADTMNFVMAANFHGGSEVVNYPWDTWPQLHADDNWWVRESSKYADTAMALAPSGYFTSVNPNGITNGYAWYTISGGRQDYMNYFKHCREFTIELSVIKITPTTDLVNNWDYNYRSWMNYMEEALHGIRGVIKDACTNQAVKARVFISGHDFDSSHVYSALPVGNYHRPIYQGTYNVTYSAPGYQSQTINNVVVTDGNATVVDISLNPITPTANFTSSSPGMCGGTVSFTDLSGSADTWLWSFGDGSTSTVQNPTHNYNTSGTYNVQLKTGNCAGADSLLKNNFVTVTVIDTPSVQSATASVCGPASLILSASSSGTNNWYDAATGGTLLASGNSYTTPLLSSTTTYYVENDAGGTLQHVGALDNSIGSGGYYTAGTYHYLIFSATSAFKLVSIWVDANTSGSRTIELRNSAGTVLQSTTINISAGQNRIALNFNVPVGTDLQLGVAGNNNLFRNSSGGSYPYSINGIISITGNSAGNLAYYYYFYDWEIIQSCTSIRVPVTASINVIPPTPVISLSGSVLTSGSSSGNQWYDSSSGLLTGETATTMTVTQDGDYYVIVTGANGCKSDTSNVIAFQLAGMSEVNTGQCSIYPNPSNGNFIVELSGLKNENVLVEMYSVLGKLVYHENTNEKILKINSANLENGIYFLQVATGSNVFSRKIILRKE